MSIRTKNQISISFLFLLCCDTASANTDKNISKSRFTTTTSDKIYWSDGDSGQLGNLKFRLANIDAPETGSLKQRGGAKCELERELGFEAKAFMVEFTRGKTIRIVKDYGKDRYGRLVVDIETEDGDIASAGVNAGHLEKWPHLNGRAQSPKPDWCVTSEN